MLGAPGDPGDFRPRKRVDFRPFILITKLKLGTQQVMILGQTPETLYKPPNFVRP